MLRSFKLLFLSVFFVFAISDIVSAQSFIPVDLDGYAWSSNIGWISLNCATGGLTGNNICGTSNYKVTINSDNTITGYAWSSNIGWIKFGGLSGFPSVAGTVAGNAQVSGTYPSYTMRGWARACSATEGGNCSSMTTASNSGGWDGWISLGKTTSPAYSVSLNRTVGMSTNSYAWGSDVVGWIDMFSDASFASLVATISGTGCQIALGSGSCNGSLSWSIPTGTPTPNVFKNRTPTSQISTALTGSNQVVSLSQGLTQFQARSGSTVLQTTSLTATCAVGLFWNATLGTCTNTAPGVAPVLNISVAPTLVRSGDNTNVSWTMTPTPVTDGTCTVTGPGVSVTGTTTNGSISSADLIAQSTFRLRCEGSYGTVDARATVEVVPKADEV